MINPRHIDYVRQNIGKYSMDIIRQGLLKGGVSAADADESIRLATAPPPLAPFSSPTSEAEQSAPNRDSSLPPRAENGENSAAVGADLVVAASVPDKKDEIPSSRGMRAAPFAVGIFCFMLPFLQVSCNGMKMVQLSGAQLVMGTEVKDSMSGKTQKISSDICAVLALAALVAGAAFCMVPGSSSGLAAISGAVALISMFVFKTRTDSEIMKQSAGLPIAVEYLTGFWMTCLAAAAGLVLSALRLKDSSRAGPASPRRRFKIEFY